MFNFLINLYWTAKKESKEARNEIPEKKTPTVTEPSHNLWECDM